MSGNYVTIQKHLPDTDSNNLTDTHHVLSVLLLELGEPWKDVREPKVKADFIYVKTATFGALFRQGAELSGNRKMLIAQFPEGRYKTNDAPLLYHKGFVRKLYPALREELSKEGVKQQLQQKGRLHDRTMAQILIRAGFMVLDKNLLKPIK